MTNAELEAELGRIYLDWFARIGTDPGDFFERVLADDWVYTDYLGVVRYKPDYEPYIRHVPRDRAPAPPRGLRARRFGNVAIVDGSYLAPGGPTDSDQLLRFTAVWAQRDGQWQALAHHTSAVAVEE